MEFVAKNSRCMSNPDGRKDWNSYQQDRSEKKKWQRGGWWGEIRRVKEMKNIGKYRTFLAYLPFSPLLCKGLFH